MSEIRVGPPIMTEAVKAAIRNHVREIVRADIKKMWKDYDHSRGIEKTMKAAIIKQLNGDKNAIDTNLMITYANVLTHMRGMLLRLEKAREFLKNI
jgi:hypothetical protein